MIYVLFLKICILFRYGLPDPGLERDFDIFVQLEMSSVRYIHTQRFISEILAFAQHFNQMQDVLGQWRAATSGKKVVNILYLCFSFVSIFCF